MFKTPSIPPITDPLGKYWEQPDLNEIELSLSHAHMNLGSFHELKIYQTSLPTGVYYGKMWKKQDHRGRWLLCWYGPNPDPNFISINYLRIQIK